MALEENREQLAEQMRDLIEAGKTQDALALLTARHPADQADLIEELAEESWSQLVAGLNRDEVADILEYLEEEARRQFVAKIDPVVLASILDRVEDDVAADIVQDLPEETKEQVLLLLEDRKVKDLLEYAEETAGGRMSPDVIALHRSWTTDEAIDFLRRQRPDVEQPFYLYAVDDERRLQGVVSLRSLLVSAPDTRLEQIMTPEVITVPVDYDQEVAAERMRHYNLLALPVVDDEGHIRGVLTADDILDVQVEEATEDMFRMVGLAESESIFRPIRQSVPPRLGWLLVNLVTAFLAAGTVSFFEGTVEKVAALAVFMPVVAGMGGNAGIQTITLVVRSLALGEIGAGDAVLVLRKEIAISMIKGVVIGLVVGVIAWLWKGNTWLGVVVGLAMLANIMNAAVVGALVPLAFKAARADPALASGIIVTTFTDVVGFLTFLGLATLLITKLT